MINPLDKQALTQALEKIDNRKMTIQDHIALVSAMEVPELENIILPTDWSMADGTFNMVVANSLRLINPPTFAIQSPSLSVIEFQNSPDDFQRLDIAAHPGGPFTIMTNGEGETRSLQILASDTLHIIGGEMQISTFDQIRFQIDGNTDVWFIDSSGNLNPSQDGQTDIGNPSNRVRAGHITNVLVGQIIAQGGGDLIFSFGPSAEPAWVLQNDGTFRPDPDNVRALGTGGSRIQTVFTTNLDINSDIVGTVGGPLGYFAVTIAGNVHYVPFHDPA